MPRHAFISSLLGDQLWNEDDCFGGLCTMFRERRFWCIEPPRFNFFVQFSLATDATAESMEEESIDCSPSSDAVCVS